MAEPRVIFDGVWKKFRRGERHDSLRDLIPATARKLFGRKRDDELEEQEFWALKDVSFEVKPGEALGIIGPNGAGKSTTLKLLTKILRPTRGRSEVRGRVGALIEIAAGFHPDLTGRENILLQGAIMGMKRGEIEGRLEEIIDFAGVGEFVDTPVKRYSSGMNARLGFSIAAHLHPDVLIIDEVLSVGDMAFQQRCVSVMRRQKAEGTCLVFVSHNLQAVVELCDSAAYVNRGIQLVGKSEDVVAYYVRDVPAGSGRTQPDAGCKAQLLNVSGSVVRGAISPGEELLLQVEVENPAAFASSTLSVGCVRSTDGLVVYDAHVPPPWREECGPLLSGRRILGLRFRAHLARGQYHLTLHFFDQGTLETLAMLSPAAHLTISEAQTYEGVAHLDLSVDKPKGEPVAQP